MKIIKKLLAGAALTAALLLGSLQAQTPEDKLAELGIELPPTGKAIANYVSVVRTGNLLFLSGHIPRDEDGAPMVGKLGSGLSVEEGYAAARQAGIALLATLKAEVGELGQVRRVVKLFGMVNAAPDFKDHSKVINGCSDLLVEVFGDKGRHARVASGFSSLPLGVAVEIDMIVEVEVRE